MAANENTEHHTEDICINENVIVRDWDDIVKDADEAMDGEYIFTDFPDSWFNSSIRPLCGNKAIVTRKDGHRCELDFGNNALNAEAEKWAITDYMLTPVKEAASAMSVKDVVSTLEMENDLMLFDPDTGETSTPEMLNDINRECYKAHKEAIRLLNSLSDSEKKPIGIHVGIGDIIVKMFLESKPSKYIRMQDVFERGIAVAEALEKYGYNADFSFDENSVRNYIRAHKDMFQIVSIDEIVGTKGPKLIHTKNCVTEFMLKKIEHNALPVIKKALKETSSQVRN